MKAVILRDELNRGLVVVSRVVAARGQLPVLANVMITAESEGLGLAATNLELGMRLGVGGKVTEEGGVTVPARNLSEFVAAVTEEQVNLETEGEKLRVKAGGYGAVFAGIGVEEFPVMPKIGEGKQKGKQVKMKKEVVAQMAREVAFAAAVDDSRPVLTGIQLRQREGKLWVTATDGFRMSRKVVEVEKGFEWEGLILPARTILETARVIGEEKGKGEVVVELVGEGNQVILGYGQTELVSRLLEGNFPEVEKIIPKEQKTEVVVERESLVRAVRAGAIFARENNNIIKFKFAGEKLIVEAKGGQMGESEMEMEMEKEGEDGEIAFNFRYVVDFLTAIEEERIVMKMNGSLAPCVWRGEKDESLMHLIMPVRV